MPRLARIDWPHHGIPDTPPKTTLAEYKARMKAVRAAMDARGLRGLVLYGDREHAANIQWLTGFDPRFEEALLILTRDAATLLAGNEGLSYTAISPLVQSGDVKPGLCASLSLPSQPREGHTLAAWIDETVPKGPIGTIGWKWFTAAEMPDPATALDLPTFIADLLRARATKVENVTDLLMDPGHGLRARVDTADIARLEFANHMAAAALRRMIFAFKDGMSDFAAFEAAHVGGLPLGCHPTFATGTTPGLAGPSGKALKKGEPASFNICHWGANICRAGWLAHGPEDLPEAARDYLDAFAGPYLAAMSRWCAMMAPGLHGGAVWSEMRSALPVDTFNVTLNPGHLIGLDEWLSSPIYEGSMVPLASGMAMQMDVIPSHPVYGSTRLEDGYVIADADLQQNLARRFPNVALRCAARARFMRDVIGMQVPDTLLPLADTCGIVAPWLFDPAQVIVL